jgi:predicted alpha/beta-hydrolase family hydrolase
MKLYEEKFIIPVRNKTVSSTKTSTYSAPDFTFVYAPGAGSNISDPFGEYLRSHLPALGASLVQFQFPYMEAGNRGPDRPALLEETWRKVIDYFRPRKGKLVVGGRSMGGRIASQVVAQGIDVDALALFAYPLNPPSNRSVFRDRHLTDISVPTLCCSGSRDNFATSVNLGAISNSMTNAKFHEIDGAAHGFAVLKRSDRSREDVWREVLDVTLAWIKAIPA